MNAVAWFEDVGIADRPTVGGKGGSLGELTQAGIAVPPGFVVTTGAFEQFLEALEARAPVRARVEVLDPSDLEAAVALSQELRRRVIEEPMPEAVEQAIRVAYAELSPGEEPVAVRSSATTEDAEDASFAGLQDTFLWVLGADQMVARVRECWGSLYSVESMCYRRKQGLPEDGVAMAVVVQRMVDAMCAGVMFTRSPTTGDKSVITIEGAWGLGIANQPCLTDDQLMALREIGRTVERHYGKPQDIEWALDDGGNVFLLQSRPETVWAAKDAAAPVKPPEDNPLKHVMSIFGGKR